MKVSDWYLVSNGPYVFAVWDITVSGILDMGGLAQDCSNSSALAMELLQSCTKTLIWYTAIKSEYENQII